jgi:hypothetical protein
LAIQRDPPGLRSAGLLFCAKAFLLHCRYVKKQDFMCQNWYAVIGQTLDIVGFLTIVFEWYHQYKRDHDRRMGELEKAYERNSAEILGRLFPDQDKDKMMWREFQNLFLREWKWRRKVFFTGACLVIFGFAFQVLGNWPHAFNSC